MRGPAQFMQDSDFACRQLPAFLTLKVLTNWKLHDLKVDLEMLTQKSEFRTIQNLAQQKLTRFPTPNKVIGWRRQCPANNSIMNLMRARDPS